MRRLVLFALGLVFVCGPVLPSRSRAAAADLLASPFLSLNPRLLVPRFLDVGPSCADLIEEADGDEPDLAIKQLHAARRKVRAATRAERSGLRAELEQLARSSEVPLIAICARLENARIALRAGFGPEAKGEIRRAARLLPESEWPSGLRDLANYLDAESLVVMRRESDALETLHSLAHSAIPEFVLAAELRLFDLTTRPGVVEPSPLETSVPGATEPGAALPDVSALGGAPTYGSPLRVFPLDLFPLEEHSLGEGPILVRPLEVIPRAAAVPEAKDAYRLWKQLESLLAQARERNFDLSSWSSRAGEHAFLAGRLSNAHHWFAVAEGIPVSRRLAAIRKSDVLMSLRRPADARRTLERAARRSPNPAVRDLARVRLVRYALVTEGDEKRLRFLELASHSEHPVVASIAREELALELIDRGDPDAALVALRKIAYAAPTLPHVPRYTATLDTALGASVRERDCSEVLGRLAQSWELFLRHTTRPEPFATVGECFVEMGMPSEALLVYRAIARTLGVDSVPDLAWRVARASLGSSDLRSARASIRASLRSLGGKVPLPDDARPRDIRIADAEAARWWWLAAELAFKEGRDSEAQRINLALLSTDNLPGSLRPSVEARLVAQTAGGPIEAAHVEAVLAQSLRRVVAGAEPERAFVRAQLADRAWETGAHEAAGSEYRQLHAGLDVPTPRNRAEYRGALAVGPADTARELLLDAALDEPQNAWSRLSRIELRLMSLREAVGLASQVHP